MYQKDQVKLASLYQQMLFEEVETSSNLSSFINQLHSLTIRTGPSPKCLEIFERLFDVVPDNELNAIAQQLAEVGSIAQKWASTPFGAGILNIICDEWLYRDEQSRDLNTAQGNPSPDETPTGGNIPSGMVTPDTNTGIGTATEA
jgi:hypothetical protein